MRNFLPLSIIFFCLVSSATNKLDVGAALKYFTELKSVSEKEISKAEKKISKAEKGIIAVEDKINFVKSFIDSSADPDSATHIKYLADINFFTEQIAAYEIVIINAQDDCFNARENLNTAKNWLDSHNQKAGVEDPSQVDTSLRSKTKKLWSKTKKLWSRVTFIYRRG